jgi:hypothetical protein
MMTIMAIERSSLVAFDVTAKGRVEYEDKGEGEHLDRFEFRFALDIPGRRMRVSRLDHFRGGEEERQVRVLYVDTPEWEIHGNDKTAVVYAPGVSIARKPAFFDPRAVGLYFCGDYARGSSAETMFGHYSQWDDSQFKKTKTDDGKIILEYGMADRVNATSIMVDPEKGYWPIALCHFEGDEMHVQNTSVIARRHDMWLPVETTIVCRSRTIRIKYTWHSANAPLDDKMFSQGDIAKERNVQMIHHRSSPKPLSQKR